MVGLHYWQQFKLRDENMERMRVALLSPRENNKVPEAFYALLRSGDPDAVCVAINYYSSAASSVHFGGENQLAAATDEVLERARAVLRGELEGEGRAAQDDLAEERVATALSAIMELVEPRDTPLVLKALAIARSEEGIEGAGYAAAHLLEVLLPGSDESEELIAVLARVAFDESVPHRSRWPALGAMGMSSSETSINWLMRALDLPTIELQAVAGMALAELDLERFRPRLERMVASWPEVSDYPAYQMVALLRES
ncbi:hypothetical protein AB0L71_23075 [Streptomyces sp. NPDC052052]|uniref:hypothetical protein n=1 Tax=Streptomyces sp. NPDC052052 TaxID=3154756 RepID=UPI003429283E